MTLKFNNIESSWYLPNYQANKDIPKEITTGFFKKKKMTVMKKVSEPLNETKARIINHCLSTLEEVLGNKMEIKGMDKDKLAESRNIDAYITDDRKNTVARLKYYGDSFHLIVFGESIDFAEKYNQLHSKFLG